MRKSVRSSTSCKGGSRRKKRGEAEPVEELEEEEDEKLRKALHVQGEEEEDEGSVKNGRNKLRVRGGGDCDWP